MCIQSDEKMFFYYLGLFCVGNFEVQLCLSSDGKVVSLLSWKSMCCSLTQEVLLLLWNKHYHYYLYYKHYLYISC